MAEFKPCSGEGVNKRGDNEGKRGIADVGQIVDRISAISSHAVGKRSVRLSTAAARTAISQDAHLDVLVLGVDRTQVGYSYIGTGAVVLQATLDQTERDAREVEAACKAALAEQEPTLKTTAWSALYNSRRPCHQHFNDAPPPGTINLNPHFSLVLYCRHSFLRGFHQVDLGEGAVT